MQSTTARRRLHVVYVLPSRYDDEGYVHRYWRGVLPSNTLATLRSLTLALRDSRELGPDVELSVQIFDDSVQRVPIRRIVRRARTTRTKLVVGIVGVQSNQFPRAADLATQFRAADVAVMIGGFHVSGVLALFDSPTPELQRMLDIGVTLVRGEAEAPGALATILTDALNDSLRPVYNITNLPDLTNAAVPTPDPDYMRHFVWKDMGTIDTSRGCPFNCSFCTIINVQGRTMRHRSPESILRTIRSNYARGVKTYFFTDDNLSRCPAWEPLFDGLAALRDEGMPISFMMQVDTQAWKIPRFVEKAQAAGCYLVFVGMETVNAENIAAAGKRQNKVHEFARMVDAWHRAGILVEAGYIIGFPHDTVESVRRDIEFLKDHVKVDEAAFFMMTPLPGSRDHSRMVRDRVPMDADLNNYDSFHETFRHPRIAPGAWRALYDEAWKTFYSKENITHILLRTPPQNYWRVLWLSMWNRYSNLLGSHPMVTGLIRLKGRTERRPIFARESLLSYGWRRAKESLALAATFTRLFFEFQEIWMLTRKKDDPRWATLAEFYARWSAVQQSISQYDVSGKCDDALQVLRDVLESSARRLRSLCAEAPNLNGRLRRRLRAKADEIDGYVRGLKSAPPSWQHVVQAQHYVKDSILAGYENLAIRYVARRRQFNAYRSDLMRRLKSGRILSIDLAPLPRLVLYEFAMAVRFTLAFYMRAG
ncbi:MAG: hypothetical protein AMXMBFR4_33680 [Candidatus Hydrogenedentota bacterium]